MSKGNPPECLTPTLKNSALSEMLVKVAEKDKHYVGCEELSQSQEVTPEKATSPTATIAGKKAPMTLSLADSRMFVINNGEVMKEGGSMSTGDATAQVMDHSGLRYYHAGMVMELIPGQTPFMKAVNAYNPEESIDCGSSISEIIQRPNVITPIEQCFVESGFCAYLVLHYDDPENPKLEAMNAPTLQKKLKDLEGKGLTPSDEHFTPLVNIAREPAQSSQDDYTTAIFFTTKMYTYYIYVENQSLVLKKYKTGDPSWQAKPQNNKQFLDRRFADSCVECSNTKPPASQIIS